MHNFYIGCKFLKFHVNIMLISNVIFIFPLSQVHRACAEREILDMLDHPFLPALYASFQVFFIYHPHIIGSLFSIIVPFLYINSMENVTCELGAPGDN